MWALRWIVTIALVLAVATLTGAVRSAADTTAADSISIVIKLKPALAAEAEIAFARPGELRPLATPLGNFMRRHGLEALRPVHEARVRTRLRTGLSDEQLALETLRRFPRRGLRRRGGLRPPDPSTTYTVRALVASRAEADALLSRVARDPDVEFAEEDKVARISLVPNDPYYASAGSWGQAYDDLYGLKKVGAATAWDASQGQGVTVAVVDTGVDYAHPDIADNIWTNAGEIPGNAVDDDGNGYVDDVRGWDFVGPAYGNPLPDADPRDGHGHGSHVAGTAAAAGENGIGVVGMAFRARVMAVKGLDNTGRGLDSQLAAAVVYAADNGADVINASWGGPGDSQVLREAVDYAADLGVVFVASAGNSAADARNFHPSAFARVITVAASDFADATAYFSNWGPKIDVTAPGVDILSLRAHGTSGGIPLNEGYTRMSGTSMASPHVSGLAALILAHHPTYSTEQVRQALRVSAHDLGPGGFDTTFGYGRIDATQALAVDTALEVAIQSPEDGSAVTGGVAIAGVASGAGFVHYELAYGNGITPASWVPILDSTTPVTGGTLGTFDAAAVPDGVYTLRLTAFDAAGRAYVDRRVLLVDYVRVTGPAQAVSRLSVATLKTGATVTIGGTAIGPSFVRFRAEWARGVNPASGWSSSGITLAGGGWSPVSAGTLATWSTAGITAADFHTVRVLVDNAGFTSESRTIVYLEPDLLSAHWPRAMNRGAWPDRISALPALDGAGQRNLVVTSPQAGSVRFWRFAADGSSVQTTDEVIVNESGGFFQAPTADLDGQAGDETVVPWTNFLRVLRPDGTAYNLPGPSGHGLQGSVPVVADVDGLPGYEVLAAATFFSGGSGRLQAWKADGTPLGGAFPVALTDHNLSVTNAGMQRIVVADLDGDGVREIVVAEGPTPSTVSLRLIRPDGTPKEPWAAPSFDGSLKQLAAGDLDGDGTTEVILFLAGSSPVLHVLNADGTPRPGWPRTFTGEPNFAIADLDRDGQNEIVVASSYWLHVLRGDGQPFSPAWPRSGIDYFGPPVVGDVDGDGLQEIVVGVHRNAYFDPMFPLDSAAIIRPTYYTDHQLLALRRDGTVLRSWQILGANGQDAVGLTIPLLADVDGEGHTDIVLTLATVVPGGSSVTDGLVTVLATGGPYRAGANDWPALRHDARSTSVLPRDTTPPAVAVTAPEPGATISDTTTLRAHASDDVFARGVQFQVDGAALGVEDITPPFETTWDPRSVGNGEHVLTAVARDSAGNLATSAPVTVTVDVDSVAPQAAVTAPAGGSTISAPIAVEADASDDRGVTRVELYLDSVLLATDTAVPYSFAWDPGTVADGAHTLLVKAYDAAANVGTSPAVPVTVAVPPAVSLTSPAAGATISNTATLVAQATDNGGVALVEFYAGATLIGTDSSAPWMLTWNALAVPDGPYALTARAVDGAGNAGLSAAVPVTVSHAPAVWITSPAPGAVVGAPIVISATASDGGGIVRVELWVDGVLKAADVQAPYAFDWDPSAYTDGFRSLVAKAYDTAGNVGTSATVTVRVAVAPAVAITSPGPGAVLTGTVSVAADAADNTGVIRVEFYVDGALAGNDVAAPWTLTLDSAAYGDGSHTLTARAFDLAANVGISPGVAVTTRNNMATYDPSRKAPVCSTVGPACDSGSLLNGRGTRGPEPNYPNTIGGSCADSSSGTYHADESNDRVRVATLDASPLRAGKTVEVRATVWAYSGYTSDKLDLYYASNAQSPAWTLIGTFTPPGAGARTITATYSLPFGALQAVRARFRYGGAAAPCGTGGFDDHDDLVFAVDSPVDGAPPTAAITSPTAGATVAAPLTIAVDAADDVGVTRVELHVDGALAATDTTAPYAFAWNPGSVGDGSHALVAKAYDLAGNVGPSPSIPVTVAVAPTASITAPASGAVVSGTVAVTAQAFDNTGIARVEFTVDGSLRATSSTAPYGFAWNTTGEVGSHTLVATAYDAAGLSGASTPVAVQVQSGTGGSAVYHSGLKAPRCSGAGSSCDSGTLLVGRGTRGPEPNAPNTIASSCADGAGGTFHVDESNDRVKVSTLDGSNLAPGKAVRIDATVWAYSSFGSDRLDLYYAANASAPVWTFVATLAPSAAGAQVLSATYTLPPGNLQAVRARFRYGGSATPCATGSYDDHDDLVFEAQ
jgi:subtilisin family serine protease